MDADSWLYLLGPHLYGQYHRVASHSLLGLTILGTVAALIGWEVARRRPPWRRFGWFVSDNLTKEVAPPPRAPFWLFAAVGLGAAYMHLVMDAITAWGNVLPLWPWSDWDVSIYAVNSLDLIILAMTLGWHVALRHAGTRRREIIFTIPYVIAVAAYVAFRYYFGPPAFA